MRSADHPEDRNVPVGLLRKTASIFTVGVVSFRSQEDRMTRYARQTRNAARAQVAQQAVALEHQRQLITQGEYAAVQQQVQAGGQQQMHFQQLQAITQMSRPGQPPVPPQPLHPRPPALPHALPAPPPPRPVPPAPPAGWYPDQQDPRLVRWFDGMRWTEHTQPRA
ncbi:DUF2510 domain-containing protein [Geodermatophilus sp. SYSU D01045]